MSTFKRFRDWIKTNKAGALVNNSARVTRDYLRFLANKNKIRGVQPEQKFKIVKPHGKSSQFFGYYDISSFNPKDDNLILLHSVEGPSFGKYSSAKACEICSFDLRTGEQTTIDKTRAWNWQQGSRLGWLDEQRIIYNVYQDNQYKACIAHVSSNQKRYLNKPVMAWFKSEYYCSVDFVNLYKNNKDYGYNAHLRSQTDEKYLSINTMNDDVIFSLDSSSVLNKLTGTCTNEMYETSFFNHPIFSPDGSRMIFLFRYFNNNNKLHHVLVWNKDTNTYEQVYNKLVSHYTWLNNHELLYWGVNDEEERGYHVINVDTSQVHTVNTNVTDGHPSMLNSSKFITDSYNLGKAGRSVSIIDMEGNVQKLFNISEFPTWSYLTRCDPHPSVSMDGNRVQIDLLTNRFRKVAIFDV